MKQVFKDIEGKRFHSLDEVTEFLKAAGYEVVDVTTQYATVRDNDEIIPLIFGGSTDNFGVCYMW